MSFSPPQSEQESAPSGSEGCDSSLAHAAAFLDSLPIEIVATDLAGTVLFANRAWERGSEASKESAVGKSAFALLNLGASLQFLTSSHAGRSASVVLPAQGQNSPLADLNGWSVAPRTDSTGSRIGWTFVRSVSTSPAAGGYQSGNEQLAAFPKWNPNPVLEFGPDGRLTYYNEAALGFARLFGRSSVEDLLPPETQEILGQCRSTGQPKLRLEKEHGDRVISWSFFPIRPLGVVHCYAGDVTERRVLEQQFRQSQKLESLGRLAGGVAHDFNNLLTVIKGQASCLATGELPEPSRAEALQHILLAAERGSNLTRQLLTFSRQHSVQFRSVDLNDAIRSIQSLLSRMAGEDIRFLVSTAPTLSPVWADVSMLEQVLLNLVVNSRDAMPSGGTVTISTEEVEVASEYEARNPEAKQGHFVRLSIEDTGCGISPELLPRIFEPFFSTKPPGKGTGLGLATVYGIVRQHHGWIRVFSEPGRGTRFQVHLPCTTHPILSPKLIPTGGSPRDGQPAQECILVVEDEEPVRSLIVSALRSRGYEVHEAATGADALDRFHLLDGRVDLLLSDVVMPGGVNGKELAANLLRQQADLGVLLITGYNAEPLGGAPIRFHCLAKPFDLDDLHAKIRQVLDERSLRITS